MHGYSICIYISIYKYIYMLIYKCMCACTDLTRYTKTEIYVCVSVYEEITRTCPHVRVYACMCVTMKTHIKIYK